MVTPAGSERTEVTSGDLARALGDLGLSPGVGLMVHSSLRSFGHLRGGARGAIDALMAAVGAEGTLLFPSFNHGAAFRPGAPGYYHPHETPTTNGIIPDTFWRLPGVVRSLHPTHAFAAWGASAERYVAGHHRTLTMGADSPLGLLARDGGYCLLVGVDYRSNTSHHVAETLSGARCLGRRTEAYPVHLPDGRRVVGRTWAWRAGRCPITDAQRYPEILRGRGLDRQVRVGECTLTLFRLADCLDVVGELLCNGIGDYPPCARGPVHPQVTEHTVPSDWNDAAGVLCADSDAWRY